MNTAFDRTAEDAVTLLAGQDFPDVIFVVDGDATYRMLLACLLKKNGFNGYYHAFSDEVKFLNYLIRSDLPTADSAIAIIFCVRSLKKRELEVLELFKNTAYWKRISIIVHAYEPTQEFLNECVRIGAMTCLERTNNVQELIEILKISKNKLMKTPDM